MVGNTASLAWAGSQDMPAFVFASIMASAWLLSGEPWVVIMRLQASQRFYVGCEGLLFSEEIDGWWAIYRTG